MQVIVNIDGRRALPVRALCFIAGQESTFTGDALFRAQSIVEAARMRHLYDSMSLPQQRLGLPIYQLASNQHRPFPVSQWGCVAEALDNDPKQDANTVRHIPAATFVWLDDFELWIKRLCLDDDDPAQLLNALNVISLDPYVPPELEKIVAEGFPPRFFACAFEPLLAALSEWFEHPLSELPLWQRHRVSSDFWPMQWDKLTPDCRRNVARQWDGAHSPENELNNVVGWCDKALDAATWWSLSSVTAQEAAALLCRFNPSDEQDNPLEITTDETNPNDFKLLKRVLEDVERSIPQSRTLADWLAVAHEKRLKHHSWANVYEKARQALQAADASETSESTIVVEGRKALPLRLLPFVGRWEWMTSPDGIAHACSLPAEKLHAASGLQVRDREALKSFVFQGEKWREITTEEWDFFKVELDSLTKTLKADERGEHEDNKNFAAWRRQALEKLPARAFVWLDDFQDWFSATRPLKNCANTGHDDDLEETVEKESDVLTLSPIIPNDLYALVFEGFSRAPVRNVPFKDLTLKSTGRSTDPSVEPPFESTTRQSAKGKPGRRPSAAPALLEDILKALEDFAASSGEPFDRQVMPGPLGKDSRDHGSFHWLCGSLYRQFIVSSKHFATQRNGKSGMGKCSLAPWAGKKPSTLYTRALPAITSKLKGTRSELSARGKKEKVY